MGSRTAVLSIRVVSDAKQARQELESTASTAEKFGKGLDKITPYAAAAGAGILVMATKATAAASDVQQAMGGVEAVFKGNAGQVKEWARGAAESVGLATSEYGTMATLIGAQLKNAGTPMDELAGKTDGLIKLGADLAAMYGGTTADAVGALSSALKGEMDPIEAYGISLNQAAIDAQLAADAAKGVTYATEQQGKAAAVMALLTKQSGDAQGAFAREADTAAVAQQKATAEWANAAAALGEQLLPVATQLAVWMGDMARLLVEHQTAVTAVIAVIGGLAAGVLAANAVMKVWAAWQTTTTVATKAWTVAQKALNVVLRANPIGLVITAVGLLVAGIMLLWNKNEGFRNFVTGAWAVIAASISAVVDWLKDKLAPWIDRLKIAWAALKIVGKAVWDTIGAAIGWVSDKIGGVRGAIDLLMWPINAVRDAFSAVWDVVQSVINAIRNIRFPSAPGWLKSVGNLVGIRSAAAPMALGLDDASTLALVSPVGYDAAATDLIRPAAVAASSGMLTTPQQQPLSIVVNGALDPLAVGRQIESIMGKYLRAQGRRTQGQLVFA